MKYDTTTENTPVIDFSTPSEEEEKKSPKYILRNHCVNMTFNPQKYFDFSNFEHAALFSQEMPVWDALKKIKQYLLSKSLGQIRGVVHKNAYLIHPEAITIGENSIVEAGAYIEGPCIIGKNCHVKHGAYIRGNLITGNDCVIGHATEVKHAIFFNHVKAAHFSYVGDSILGNGVNLGAGTKCANLRFNKNLIEIQWEGEKINTQLKKFGAILGDGVHTGCNSVTNPGTLMGKKSFLFPCQTANGVILENQKVK